MQGIVKEYVVKHIRNALAIVTVVALATLSIGTVAASTSAPADVVRNDPTEGSGPELLTRENTLIDRDADGVTITLRIPTPLPGSYAYPEDIPPERWAYPEAFTGWAAIFNNPELCTTSETPPYCGPGDRNDEVKYGMYHFAGHTSSLTVVDGELMPDVGTDGMIILTGTIGVDDQQRDMPSDPEIPKYPLENPEGAEIHALIAPHGQIDLTNPDELFSPTGNSKCGCRWIGFFSPTQ